MFDISLFESIPRFFAPLLLASLGGALCERASVFNIALEGKMLIGAFFAVVGAYYGGSWWTGILLSMFAGVAAGLIFGWFSIYRKGDDIVVSIGLNIFALGLTVFLLRLWFDTRGQFDHPDIAPIPKVNLPVIESIPYVGDLLSGHSVLVWVSVVAVFLIQFLLYRHRFGLRLRAAGDNVTALRTVGLVPERTQLAAVVACGVLCSLAGSQLSISNVTLFTEGMSAGRGWIAVVIVMMCAARPYLILVAALFFGFVDALGFRIQSYGMPQQFTDALPYVMAIVIMTIAIQQKRNRRKTKPSNGR